MTIEVNKAETQFISDDAGNGLFASEDIEAGDVILQVKDPYVLIPRSSVIHALCYGCLVETANLKCCTGCQTVFYCSKTCQKKSWKDAHKLECKVFRKCKDNGHSILPTPVRGLLGVLLRHPTGIDPDPGWFHLETHKQKFMKSGEIWEDIKLQALAALQYSGLPMSMMDTATSLLCSFKINAFNATQPDDTPIGLCFEPLFAIANHSCVANTLISFNGRTASFKALRPIRGGEEITIHYVDTNQPLDIRRKSLRERYFFTCTCSKCSEGWNVYATFQNNPCRSSNDRWIFSDCGALEEEACSANAAGIDALAQKYELIDDMVNRANGEDAPAAIHASLRLAFNLLREVHWGPIIAAAPYPTVLRSLVDNYVAANEVEAALILLLTIVFHVQPFHFPEAWHPIRVETLRGVANLISLILAAPKFSLHRLRAIHRTPISDIDLFPCVCAVLLLLVHYAPRSHGLSSKLLKEVQNDLVDVECYANNIRDNDCLVMFKMGIWNGDGRLAARRYFGQLEKLGNINLMRQIIESVDCKGNGVDNTRGFS